MGGFKAEEMIQSRAVGKNFVLVLLVDVIVIVGYERIRSREEKIQCRAVGKNFVLLPLLALLVIK
jgi:hypothetical protein